MAPPPVGGRVRTRQFAVQRKHTNTNDRKIIYLNMLVGSCSRPVPCLNPRDSAGRFDFIQQSLLQLNMGLILGASNGGVISPSAVGPNSGVTALLFAASGRPSTCARRRAKSA